jgi:hypothetical protein
MLSYGCETWLVTNVLRRKVQTFINRCLRYIYVKNLWPRTISNRELWQLSGQKDINMETGNENLDGLATRWGRMMNSHRRNASVESSRKPRNGETKKQLEDIHSESSWKKLEWAEVLSGGSGEMVKACRRLMLWWNYRIYYYYYYWIGTRPVTVAERSKACTVFARSEAGIVGSNPPRAWIFSVCVCVCVFLCLCTGKGIATSWSPAQGVLPTV